ncbi:hypothetical protein GO495_23285 [Chitinophaga oryziterrae]|uniref:DUF2892 domain-containing protein n=1 Tax=Chitinophaga oryziterrae TaxID=1031224 RepID=A0A6N8JE78_9BACT|nr:hypothetical protein [Chitinophaga oryziterrae]MVT43540.1 hypothetical protein [Chitinophaga oryziterrae]
MKRILKGWNIFRIIRFIIGIIIIIAAVQMHILMIGILGAMVIVQAIVNTTCCDTGTCNVKKRNSL